MRWSSTFSGFYHIDCLWAESYRLQRSGCNTYDETLGKVDSMDFILTLNGCLLQKLSVQLMLATYIHVNNFLSP
ncbi:hypothetical protein P3L10_012206 [Capsicum annuum]